jgi:3-dehydroquinate synthase
MKTLRVELGERSYPIYIGQRLLERGELFNSHVPGTRVMVVTDKTVAPLYLDPLLSSFERFDCGSVVLPVGEEHKTLKTLNRRYDRQTTLVTLGGGVVGDVGGFAAACYQRGIPYIQLPTTLLAQVDSSVGGKTGVNHALGKNMIGAFYQPRCVVVDTGTLATLDNRQYAAGIAEVVKYGLIRDPTFFQWMEDNIVPVTQRDPDTLAHVIERSCWNKAQVVAHDERESGPRALLNLGHTFGHAIETGIGYGTWLHGEAVAAGICMAAAVSVRMGWLRDAELQRIVRLLARSGLPVQPPSGLAAQRFLELMSVDKKVRQGKIRFVLLKKIGEAVVTDEVQDRVLHEVLEQVTH